MTTPPIRDLRLAIHEYAGLAITPADLSKFHKWMYHKFPDLPEGLLHEAIVVDRAVGRRTAKREAIEKQCAEAVTKFLENEGYSDLEEVAEELGFLSQQEVWDYVMEKFKLPPSRMPN